MFFFAESMLVFCFFPGDFLLCIFKGISLGMSKEEREDSASSNNSDRKSDELTQLPDSGKKTYVLKLVLFGLCMLVVMLAILVPLALITSNRHKHSGKDTTTTQCALPRPGVGPLRYNDSVPFRQQLVNGLASSTHILSIPVIGLGTGPNPYSNWNATTAYKLAQDYIDLYLQSDLLQKNKMLRIDGSIEYGYQQNVGRAVADAIEQGKITRFSFSFFSFFLHNFIFYTLTKFLDFRHTYVTIEHTHPREEIWITSKIGPSMPMGYYETIEQCYEILHQYNTTYLDLLLIHWPSSEQTSTDDFCRAYDDSGAENSMYDARKCRQSVWSAMQYLLGTDAVRSIGVSNFEANHLQDILDMNETIPAVNQIEFHGYWKEWDLMRLCESYNITINSYTPFAAPDKTTQEWTDITGLLLLPEVTSIANKYNKTSAQVWSRWQLQQGVLINPRSKNKAHMAENINVFDFELKKEEMDTLSNFQTVKKVWFDPCGLP
ncbi:hypothetical protein RFI_11434 [Reticulomyxa filosa]|uniref:NADP-dependent oxidoreductase domain-containing protein n=1 Tax=Reticulomyxa filosa TaxID=46433 RepID=X6NK15_RETFI|nr:hypothetical protein RFI_11434 [Reticulomyxa filosa]|eukprot:ETO25702.1 hypothetical protein RFI_11434 [Reticulomyxa filosa]